jgi:hypothetical protein
VRLGKPIFSLENRVWRGDRRGQTLFVLTEMVCKKTSFQHIESMDVHDVPSGFQ